VTNSHGANWNSACWPEGAWAWIAHDSSGAIGRASHASAGIAMVGNNLYFACIHGSFSVFNALFKKCSGFMKYPG
jgi:hypothetical protein